MQLGARNQDMSSVHSRTFLMQVINELTRGRALLDLLLTGNNWWMMQRLRAPINCCLANLGFAECLSLVASPSGIDVLLKARGMLVGSKKC